MPAGHRQEALCRRPYHPEIPGRDMFIVLLINQKDYEPFLLEGSINSGCLVHEAYAFKNQPFQKVRNMDAWFSWLMNLRIGMGCEAAPSYLFH